MASSKKVFSGATDLRNRTVTVYVSPRLLVRLEMDRRGMARIATGPALADATRQVIRERAMPYAIRISPRGQRGEEDGGGPRYVESFRISQGYTVIAGMRRVAAKLVNVAPHAAAVEFTGNNPHAAGYGILRRTLAHLNGIGDTPRAAKTPWKPELHPRGPGGRFAKKTEEDRVRNLLEQTREQMDRNAEYLAESNARQEAAQRLYDEARAAMTPEERAHAEAGDLANMQAESEDAARWRRNSRR